MKQEATVVSGSIKNGLLAKVIARLESEQKSPRPYPDYHDCFVFDSF